MADRGLIIIIRMNFKEYRGNKMVIVVRWKNLDCPSRPRDVFTLRINGLMRVVTR